MAVHVHVHQVMTGSFPLRVADILFTDDAVLVPEYAHLTPLFGIARGGAGTAAETARDRYQREGVAGLLDLAERTHRLSYEELVAVRLYESPRTRPKLSLLTGEGVPYAYRIHAPVDLDPLTAALESLGDRRGFDVERRSGSGYSPVESLRRFLADR